MFYLNFIIHNKDNKNFYFKRCFMPHFLLCDFCTHPYARNKSAKCASKYPDEALT